MSFFSLCMVSGICPVREIVRRLYLADENSKYFRRLHSTR